MSGQAVIRWVEVAVLAAVDKSLHYAVPDRLSSRIAAGNLVLVPLRAGVAVAVVLQCQPRPDTAARSFTLKPLLEVAEHLPLVPPDLLDLGRWIARYYFYPIGETFRVLLPTRYAQPPECRLRATSAGLEAGAPGSELMQVLIDHGPQSLPALKKRIVPWKRLRAMIEEHSAGGWLEQFYDWLPMAARPVGIKWVSLRTGPDAAEADLTGPGHELIERLRNAAGRLPLSELRRQMTNIDYWVRKLTRTAQIEVTECERTPAPTLAQTIPASPPPTLTEDQHQICTTITEIILTPRFFPVLIHGITGSGKTEIYLNLAARALASGRSALILVPEIALSTQLEAQFRQRFGHRLGVWHSAVAPGERTRLWQQLAGAEVTLTLGVRSAVFSPLRNLGLIVVDEEHDSSYKQEDRLRYHARDVALMRAKMLGIPIVLGSATPSLQTLQHCREGRYRLLSLTRRIEDQPLPELEVVDMRREHGSYRFLSRPLQDALAANLTAGRQTLLFLNRRGFANFLMCRVCGQVIRCRHCSVSLTYHQQENRLCCHYCGFSTVPPESCPTCSRPGLLPLGFGTERVEEEVKRLLPTARIVRIDRDSVANPRHLLDLLNTVRSGRADILIGTQMIAKGHDFPNLTLVGVINADTALQIADFRAGEATVQLLIQVAGRAGRRDIRGRVILQTYNPDHYTMQAVRRLDYNLFCDQELESRRALQYPPFSRFAKLLLTAANEPLVQAAAGQLNELGLGLVASFRQQDRHLALLGPAPAPLTKLKDRFRWHLYVKAWRNRDIQDFVDALMAQSRQLDLVRRTELTVDRDPVSNY